MTDSPLRPLEVAWLAGLLEGEGCFHREAQKRNYGPGVYYYPAFIVGMTDEDVVAKAAALCGVSYQSHQPARANRKRVHSFRVRGARAVSIMKQVRPYMGNRRGEKIDELLKEAA